MAEADLAAERDVHEKLKVSIIDGLPVETTIVPVGAKKVGQPAGSPALKAARRDSDAARSNLKEIAKKPVQQAENKPPKPVKWWLKR